MGRQRACYKDMHIAQHSQLTRKQGAAPQHLSQNAPAAPHVNGIRVQAVRTQHQLWRAVPARDHMLCHGCVHVVVARVALASGPLSRETEVRDAELAVPSHEQVPRLSGVRGVRDVRGVRGVIKRYSAMGVIGR